MDWVWYLFGFDGRINRAKAWLTLLVILCWMIFIAIVMLGIDAMFGNPVKSIHFSINDVFAFVDPAILRAAFLRLREGKEASPAHLVLAFFHGVGTLVFAWVYLATSIKRLHDRDKGGWWMIPYFVIPGLYAQFQGRLPDLVFPLTLAVVLLMIAGFVEIYCLRGTRWTNQFGPNPLPKVQTRPRTTSASHWEQTTSYEFVPRSTSGVDLTFAKYPAANSQANVKS
jgi:uncharacterized membrane protein YhaH (DUF805 family)